MPDMDILTLVIAIIGIIILAVLLSAFGVYAIYASISAFIAGNIVAGVLWGLYPYMMLNLSRAIGNRK